jgi:hypothetical protein
MLRRPALVLATIGCAAMLALAGCGKGSTSSSSANGASGPAVQTTTNAGGSTSFAKTKFLLHAGLAFGAFHHFIYKPFKAGDFKHPFLHKIALLEAGVAGAFVYHELKLAAKDVRSSKLLSALFSPITLVAARLAAIRSSLTGGHASAAQIDAVSSELDHVGGAAAAKGEAIGDLRPGLTQLANPPE